jgi:transcriptional repressor NrdR
MFYQNIQAIIKSQDTYNSMVQLLTITIYCGIILRLPYILGLSAMRCPYCGHNDSRVIDSRDVNEGVRRRRECLECGSRFTTYERPQRTTLLVIKKDRRREGFSREKLISGIRKACTKRPVSQETVEQMVDEIEAHLHKLGRGEVESADIGDMVMERLRQLDGIAYIRFASVYRDFADIEEVKQEADAYARLTFSRNNTNQLPLFSNEELDTVAHTVGRRAARNHGREKGDRKNQIGASPAQ